MKVYKIDGVVIPVRPVGPNLTCAVCVSNRR